MPTTPTTLDELWSYPWAQDRLPRIADLILRDPDNTVLWIGAGISAKFAGMPTWNTFLSECLDSLVPNNDPDYDVIKRLIVLGRYAYAAEYLHELKPNRFLGALEMEFSRTPNQLPHRLGYLCAREIITTNYDTILEQAMPWYLPMSPHADIDRLIEPRFRIVKIHGSITNPSTCVLSLTNYALSYNLNLRWYLLNVFARRRVIFLGTSMHAGEPFFRVLKTLQREGRNAFEHFAVVSVNTSAEGKQKANWLKDFGISLVPYIPDATHTFLDEFLAFLDSQRGHSDTINYRVQLIRAHVDARRFVDAGVHLWHICHGPITREADRKLVVDAFSLFVRQAMNGEPGDCLFKQLKGWHIDMPQMWDRALQIAVPTHKSCHGLTHALDRFEALLGTPQPIRRRTLQEFCNKVRKPASGEKG